MLFYLLQFYFWISKKIPHRLTLSLYETIAQHAKITVENTVYTPVMMMQSLEPSQRREDHYRLDILTFGYNLQHKCKRIVFKYRNRVNSNIYAMQL